MSTSSDAAPSAPVIVNPQAEELRRLSIRRREQSYYARHLQRWRQRQLQAEQQLQECLRTGESAPAEPPAVPAGPTPDEVEARCAEVRQQAEAEKQAVLAAKQAEFDQTLAAMQQAVTELEAALAKKQEELDQANAAAETALAERQAELEQVRTVLSDKQAELEQVHGILAKKQAELERKPAEAMPPPVDADKLAEATVEVQRLQRLLASRNREIAKAAEEQQRDAEAFEKQKQELSGQLAALTKQLGEKDVQVQALQTELARHHEADEARTLPPELSHQFAEKDALIEQLRGELAALQQQLAERPAAAEKPAASTALLDIKDYEVELNEFRRQLEADRREVEDQLEVLRERQAEVEELGRQAELEMARERATLSRERVQLNRLRDEVRMERERLEREDGTREARGVIQKLTDDMPGRQRARDGNPRSPRR